jgi:hypothetical protein
MVVFVLGKTVFALYRHPLWTCRLVVVDVLEHLGKIIPGHVLFLPLYRLGFGRSLDNSSSEGAESTLEDSSGRSVKSEDFAGAAAGFGGEDIGFLMIGLKATLLVAGGGVGT